MTSVEDEVTTSVDNEIGVLVDNEIGNWISVKDDTSGGDEVVIWVEDKVGSLVEFGAEYLVVT